MIRIPTHLPPPTPGEILLEEFLIPMKITQQDLADSILVPYQRINDIVHGRRGITPSTALRLAKFFGNSVEFWMNLQLAVDLFRTEERESTEIKKIRQYQPAR